MGGVSYARACPYSRTFAGLNTVLDPFQPVSTESGAQFLAKSKNIRVTDSNFIEQSVFPRSLMTLTNGHSLFCDGGACLVHQGGAMYEVTINLTLSAVKRTGMSGNFVDHAQYGQSIYYGNRQERGRYVAGAHEEWSIEVYKGPKTSRRWSQVAPIFDHLANFNGHIVFSYDNMLFTAEPGKPGLWEPKPIFSTDTKILLIKPVVTASFPVFGGVFVGDETRIAFLAGLNPREFSEPRVTNYPALEWSAAHGYADGSDFGERPGLCSVFQSTEGLCIGYPDGTLINKTKLK